MCIIIGIICWYICGICCCFIHWWTKDYDFECGDIVTAMIVGIGGPIAYSMGASMHRLSHAPTILVKRKK